MVQYKAAVVITGVMKGACRDRLPRVWLRNFNIIASHSIITFTKTCDEGMGVMLLQTIVYRLF